MGQNGSGKTNILESLYFLSTGKSFRTSSSSQMLLWNQNLTSVQAKINIKPEEEIKIESQIIRDPGTHSLSRRFKINEVIKTRKNYLGILKVVVFEPEDIRLVAGSPSRRRDFLDAIFLTSEWTYASALSQYHKALKHRNELLDLIREGKATKAELFYWDQSLIKNSEIIINRRSEFIRHANYFFNNHPHPEIQNLSIDYQASTVTPQKLENLYQQELISGYTLVGPHRDDLSVQSQLFHAPDKNLAFWGSRGQQRLAVLALRLAQIDYLETKYHQLPILLLDDIFSELDPDHQRLVVKLCQKYQTIITSADPDTYTRLQSLEPNLINL